jgi:hypothetical protein
VSENRLLLGIDSSVCEITLDVRTGHFCLKHYGMKSCAGMAVLSTMKCNQFKMMLGTCFRAFETLQGELNNVLADEQFALFMAGGAMEAEVNIVLGDYLKHEDPQNQGVDGNSLENLAKSASCIEELTSLGLVLRHMYLASSAERISRKRGVTAVPVGVSSAIISKIEMLEDKEESSSDVDRTAVRGIKSDASICVGFKFAAATENVVEGGSTQSYGLTFPYSLQLITTGSTTLKPTKQYVAPVELSAGRLDSHYVILSIAQNSLAISGYNCFCKHPLTRLPQFSEPEIVSWMQIPPKYLSPVDVSGMMEYSIAWNQSVDDRGCSSLRNDIQSVLPKSILWASATVCVLFSPVECGLQLTVLLDLSANFLGKTFGKLELVDGNFDVSSFLSVCVADIVLSCRQVESTNLYYSSIGKFGMNTSKEDELGLLMPTYKTICKQLLTLKLSGSAASLSALLSCIITTLNDLALYVCFVYLCYCNECQVASSSKVKPVTTTKKRGRDDSDTTTPNSMIARPIHVNSTAETLSIILLLSTKEASSSSSRPHCAPASFQKKGFFEMTLIDKGYFGAVPVRTKPDDALLNSTGIDMMSLQMKPPSYYFKSLGTEAAWSDTIDVITVATISNILKRVESKLELACSILT